MEKLNVAIADDNEKMLDLLGNLINEDQELELVGHASNGAEIYDIIKEKEPDVVLLDSIMPKVDGLTVMERVSKDVELKKHPAFIVVSAVGQEQITEDAFQLGANYYILKPFDNDMLLSRIKHIRQEKEGRKKDLRKVNAYENSTSYYERNLEADVTNIIHEIGVSRPYKRISVSQRCHYPFCKRYGNAQFHHKNLISYHSEKASDHTKQGRKSNPPCH